MIVLAIFDQRNRLARRRIEFEPEPERRALPLLRSHPNFTAHGINQTTADRQTKARAAKATTDRCIGLIERFKQPRLLVARDTNTGIDHFNEGRNAVFSGWLFLRDPKGDVPFLGEFDRVAKQVEQQLTHPRRIALDSGVAEIVPVAVDRQTLFVGMGRKQFHDPHGQFRQIEIRLLEVQLARFELGEVEQIIQDDQQTLRRLLGGVRVGGLLGVQIRIHEHGGHAHNGVHWRSDLVAHHRQEIRLCP